MNFFRKMVVTNVSIPSRAYQIGTCFVCQACAYCSIDLTFNNCECDKNTKPSKNNRTKKVPNVRNLVFKPEKAHPTLKNFLFTSNEKYGYKLDMNQLQFCTLCSACNSRINRDIKTADKKKENEDSSLSSEDISQSPVLQVEFRLRMSIKQKKKVLPYVVVNFTLEDPNFFTFRDVFERYICDQVGLVFKDEYELAYKSQSESGVGTLLGSEEAFVEFLKDYQNMIVGNKKVIMVVTLKEKLKKRSYQVFKTNLLIFL